VALSLGFMKNQETKGKRERENGAKLIKILGLGG
jgi:hypothetical protein